MGSLVNMLCNVNLADEVSKVAGDCIEAGAKVGVCGQHGCDCCTRLSALAVTGQAAAQLQEQIPAAQWLALRVKLVGYVQGKQAAHEEAQQQAANHPPLADGLHLWAHSLVKEGVPKRLREVVGEPCSTGLCNTTLWNVTTMLASILSLPCHGLGLGLTLTLSKHPITAMSCAALRIEQASSAHAALLTCMAPGYCPALSRLPSSHDLIDCLCAMLSAQRLCWAVPAVTKHHPYTNEMPAPFSQPQQSRPGFGCAAQRSYGTSPCMVSQDEQWECTHGVRDYMSLHRRYEQWDYVVEKEAS
ncbi:hypothetical protein V8C86DRAFT_2438837 [Haematococcus lacustris]